MANVNISVQDGSLMIVPWKVRINQGDLQIIWNLAAAGGWQFSTSPSGIVCELNPPSPFLPWDGTTAASGPGPNQYSATGVANTTGVQKRFKYSLHLVNGSDQIDVDPEIMNDP